MLAKKAWEAEIPQLPCKKPDMQEAKEKHNEREMLEAEIALRRAVNRLHVRENYGK